VKNWLDGTSGAFAGLPGLPERPKVLLVDDQAVNIQVLNQVFQGDCQVFAATSGAQALQIATAKLPDLILLDVVMPGMDGYEVCAKLKDDPLTAHIPVIFVTGHRDEESEARGLDVGAVDFISKPVNTRIVRARAHTHIQLKRQSDLLRQLVYLDGLTGVANRRRFDEMSRIEWDRTQRRHAPLCLALVDVDWFKRYNDALGHQAGDECLRAVAQALNVGARRAGDLLARYGGEEFVLLLPDTPLEGGVAVAEQLRAAVEALARPHPSADFGHVTVSVGVSCRSGVMPNASLEALLSAADANLYAAKSQGRNRVVSGLLAPEAAPPPARDQPAG